MSNWADEYIDLIEDCENRESKMTEWEAGFISSLREQIEAGRRPTLRQTEILDNIWEKVTKRG